MLPGNRRQIAPRKFTIIGQGYHALSVDQLSGLSKSKGTCQRQLVKIFVRAIDVDRAMIILAVIVAFSILCMLAALNRS
jgi:hypothetical protein